MPNLKVPKKARKINHCQEISAPEKRKCPRFSAALPIEYRRTDSAKSSFGHTINIGGGGFMVSLSEHIEVGEELRVKLFFTAGPGLDTIEASVKVVWAKSDSEKEGFYRYGLSFVDISQSEIKKGINFLNIFSDE